MKTLGKFEILGQVGQGAMGVVYKARDPFIGRLVALKTITTGLAEDPALLERFYQEARSAGTLEHPNIVTIFELGKEGNTPFIAMAFLEGGSLDKLIEPRPLIPISQKLGYIVHVCRALEYAHKRGVIHRDVKPGNVMVTSDGAVKMVDFGIARFGESIGTKDGVLIGTLAYMAPQLFRGKTADARSDIWAAGVMFYELLAYQRPFNGDSAAALMMNITSQPTPSVLEAAPGTPPDVAAIVERMLRKEVDERFQSMEEVLLELEPIWKRLQSTEVSALVADSKQLFEARDLVRAQDVVRKALLIDTANTQARNLLDRIKVELRRREIIPQMKVRVEKAENLLAAGQFEEAAAEVEAALRLDSNFKPALDLLAEVQAATEKARVFAQAIRETKQRLAEGRITEAEIQLTKVLEIDATNVAAQNLLKQIREEKSRREYQKRLSDTLHRARSFWSELRYDECIQFLLEAQRQFPREAEIEKLLDTARQDKAEQERQTLLTQARSFLRAQEFDDALKVLDRVLTQWPADSTAKNMRAIALEGREQQNRERQLREDLESIRAQVKGGDYQEAIARGEKLLQEYPQEFELGELVAYARSEYTQREKKRKLEQRLMEANQGMKSGRFKDAIQAAKSGLEEFPHDSDLTQLLERAGKQQADQEKREALAQRIKQVETKMNREELTDAIDLARQTLVHFGPDTNVGRLLRQAEDKQDQKERKKKHDQQEIIDQARTMLGAGNFGEVTAMLDREVGTELFSKTDPRVAEILREIAEKKSSAPAAPQAPESGTVRLPSSAAPWSQSGGDPAKDSLFQGTMPGREVPPPDTSAIFSSTSLSGTSAQSVRPSSPPIEKKTSKKSAKSKRSKQSNAETEAFDATRFGQPADFQTDTFANAPNRQTDSIVGKPPQDSPTTERAVHLFPDPAARPLWKRPATFVVVFVLVLGIGAGSLYFIHRQPATASSPRPKDPPQLIVEPPPPPPDPGAKQDDLIENAARFAKKDQYEEALSQLKLAEGSTFQGRRAADIAKLRKNYNEEKDNAGIREVRNQERTWMKEATTDYNTGDLASLDSAKELFGKIKSIPSGGSYKSDAQDYLENRIPARRNAESQFEKAKTEASNANYDEHTWAEVEQDLNQAIEAGLGDLHASDARQLLSRATQTKDQLAKDRATFTDLKKTLDAAPATKAVPATVLDGFRDLASHPGPYQDLSMTYAKAIETRKVVTPPLPPVQPVSVTLSEASVAIVAGQTHPFSANVQNDSGAGVNWSVTGGSIDPNGLYRAPESVTSTTKVTVTATSRADATKRATASLTITPAPVKPTESGGPPTNSKELVEKAFDTLTGAFAGKNITRIENLWPGIPTETAKKYTREFLDYTSFSRVLTATKVGWTGAATATADGTYTQYLVYDQKKYAGLKPDTSQGTFHATLRWDGSEWKVETLDLQELPKKK